MTEPLRDRVPVPAAAEQPADGDGVVWRPATADDIDAIVVLEAAIAEVDHPRYTSPREDVAENFELSHMDPARDTLVAAADGRLVAWGVVELSPVQDTLVRCYLFGGVHPAARGRGLGRRLLSWQESRGLQLLGTSEASLPGWLMVYADGGAVTAQHLVERSGYRPARYFLDLRRDLKQPIPDRPVPDGIRIETLTEDLWDATWQARNEAFLDHWGSQPVNEEKWLSFVRRESFRPQWSHVALGENADGGWEVAAFVIAQANEQDWPLQGFTSTYIDLVGTRRAWRGMGLASALLTATMRAAAADGIARAILDVDADSPTGALGLYTGLGFAEDARSVAYTKVY
jgi:mycothiol synthase